jgi:hypothetical protein
MPIVRRTRADLDLSKVDWARSARTSDREIGAQIAADADTAPVFTAARARAPCGAALPTA